MVRLFTRGDRNPREWRDMADVAGNGNCVCRTAGGGLPLFSRGPF